MSGQPNPPAFSPEIVESFLVALQEACLPGVWSKGVALTRDASFIRDKLSADELIVRILLSGRPVHPRVTLWPADEDWYCDCGDRNDPCSHIAAAAIALKNGQIAIQESSDGNAPAPQTNGVSYRLTRKERSLELERWVRGAGRETRLQETLVSFIGGIQSGRTSHPPIAATREDFSIDQLLGARSALALDRAGWARLLALLENSSDIRLDGKAVKTSGSSLSLSAQLVEENGGFRLKKRPDTSITEVFQPGLALCADTLRPVRDPELSASEREWIRGDGTFFSPRDSARLAGEILPALQAKIPVEVLTSKLPQLCDARPRVHLEVESEGFDAVSVVADLIYGDPAIARVRLDLAGAPLESIDRKSVPTRDIARERELVRELQSELHLQPGNRVTIRGDAAADFVLRTRTNRSGVSISGSLQPSFEVSSDGAFDLSFGSEVETSRVFQAWRENRSFVPLLGGGWAPLPKDWLERYGERILRLLDARGKNHRVPAYFVPETVSLLEENGQSVSDGLARLRRTLEDFSKIPEASLPEGLQASPRHYQKQGIDWLTFLRDHEMGALLADDMGLGKTLQALCAIRGRTLIVCPTSVLSSWTEQIERFRPGLAYSVYHGGGRKLDRISSVCLTTYGILRLDREILASENWETIVLDEAHQIKNPDSQIARAAHSLRGRFRIALSGTPVENRLDDLWSQFQFVNPGLLGSRETFQDTFIAPIARGDRLAGDRLRSRIRPFILRRLKKEVAPELPPRTEVVLHCELAEEEQDLYDSILSLSRTEVLEQLEHGGSVIAALETLLRLRQACCHPALVPGQNLPQGHSSSKTSLLMDTLDASIAMGHRSLIFSQWTSYLDLIEPLLERAGIAYLRLDGATADRQEVVRRFQAADGPPVLLLSLKAGGVGLTLTAADHVFLMDPWWNPAVEDQAADRAHRIGQENPVLIHRLVAKNSIEDRILQLQREKTRLSDTVLEGASSAIALTRDDLLSLLS